MSDQALAYCERVIITLDMSTQRFSTLHLLVLNQARSRYLSCRPNVQFRLIHSKCS